MQKTNEIRPIVLAWIEKDDQLLVFKAHDTKTGKEFYRMLGGGVEFSETSEQALKREIREEIDQEIEDIVQIKVFENIFIYEELQMHEIVFLCKAKLSDKTAYNLNEIDIIDSKVGRKAIWVKKSKLKELNFYPDGIKELL